MNTIDACLDPTGTVALFYCDYCGTIHSHGTGGKRITEFPHRLGHRLAHCHSPNSPYRHKGYELVIIGEMANTKRYTIQLCCERPGAYDPPVRIADVQEQMDKERRAVLAAACWN